GSRRISASASWISSCPSATDDHHRCRVRLRYLPVADRDIGPARWIRRRADGDVQPMDARHAPGRLDDGSPDNVSTQAQAVVRLALGVRATNVPDDSVAYLVVAVERVQRVLDHLHPHIDRDHLGPAETDDLFLAACVADWHLDRAVGLYAGGDGAMDGVGDVLVGPAESHDLDRLWRPPLLVDLHGRVVENPRRPDARHLPHRR